MTPKRGATPWPIRPNSTHRSRLRSARALTYRPNAVPVPAADHAGRAGRHRASGRGTGGRSGGAGRAAPAAKPAPPKTGLPYKAKVDFPPAPYTQVLAVRSEPNSNSAILARLPEGSIVTIVKVQGNWGAFKKGGWGSLTYIKPL
jgi:hypothetical protein